MGKNAESPRNEKKNCPRVGGKGDIMEYLLEGLALAAIVLISYVWGHKSVHIEERAIRDAEPEYLIQPPKRQDNGSAKALAREYRRYNERTAKYLSGTMIVLPSTTKTVVAGILGFIASFAMVVSHHFDGLAQAIIGTKVYDTKVLWDGQDSAFLLILMGAAVFGVIVGVAMNYGISKRAHALAEIRTRKLRTVVIAQKHSVSEICAILKWAAQEEIAEQQAKHARKIQKARSKSNIIQMYPKLKVVS